MREIHKKTHHELLRSRPSVKDLSGRKRNPIYLVLDNVRSRYNVGAIFRTGDGALIEKIFLSGITPLPPHKEIDKSALGATDVVPWQACADVSLTLQELKGNGVTIVALELTHESKLYTDPNYNFPVCLVVGSEVEGISEKILNMCDFAVQIPMLGRASSLNVSTAAGVAIYELLRQFKNS